MGFFKDLGDIKRQAKELSADHDPGAQLREMNARLTALNASMVAPPAAAPVAPAGPGPAQV